MTNDWIIGNLNHALETWNSKLLEIWSLITETPETFKGGTIWNIIENIYDGMQAIGLALLVLFFVVGVMKTAGSITEIKRPEHVVKLLIRFALAKLVITYGMELMLSIFKITQGIVVKIIDIANLSKITDTKLPDVISKAIEKVSFLNLYLYGL